MGVARNCTQGSWPLGLGSAKARRSKTDPWDSTEAEGRLGALLSHSERGGQAETPTPQEQTEERHAAPSSSSLTGPSNTDRPSASEACPHYSKGGVPVAAVKLLLMGDDRTRSSWAIPGQKGNPVALQPELGRGDNSSKAPERSWEVRTEPGRGLVDGHRPRTLVKKQLTGAAA